MVVYKESEKPKIKVSKKSKKLKKVYHSNLSVSFFPDIFTLENTGGVSPFFQGGWRRNSAAHHRCRLRKDKR